MIVTTNTLSPHEQRVLGGTVTKTVPFIFNVSVSTPAPRQSEWRIVYAIAVGDSPEAAPAQATTLATIVGARVRVRERFTARPQNSPEADARRPPATIRSRGGSSFRAVRRSARVVYDSPDARHFDTARGRKR